LIVVDASAALSALLRDGTSRGLLADDQLHAPHLIDFEIAHGLRRQVALGHLSADDGFDSLDIWRRLGITRYPGHSLLQRVWELRENLSAYDAGYVALAEALDCTLVTADRRLSRAPGPRCPITVVPT
jgi:predicted nucleic acid-binding protein